MLPATWSRNLSVWSRKSFRSTNLGSFLIQVGIPASVPTTPLHLLSATAQSPPNERVIYCLLNSNALGYLPSAFFWINEKRWSPELWWIWPRRCHIRTELSALAPASFSWEDAHEQSCETSPIKDLPDNFENEGSQSHWKDTSNWSDRVHVSSHWTTYPSLLRQCKNAKSLTEGKGIHTDMIKTGHEQDVFSCNLLIQMYSKCGALEDAYDVFARLNQRNVFSWTILIGAYTQHGRGHEALELFDQMRLEGVTPSNATFVSVLSVCASCSALSEGKRVHDCIMGSSFALDVMVANALITMYGKCGSVEDSQRVFERMVDLNVVSWNAMITVRAQCDQGRYAFGLFQQMKLEGFMPNDVTLIAILEACVSQEDLPEGRCIQACFAVLGLESNIVVGTALINMYSRCGNFIYAQRMFETMLHRNVVSWNSMISVCILHGRFDKGFQLFQEMQLNGIIPDKVSTSTILSACANLGRLVEGKGVHALVVDSAMDSNMSVCNAIINMYSKCGSLEDSQRVFYQMFERDIATWNAMILGYLQHQHDDEAFQLFNQLQLEGLTPDNITLVSILSASSMHAGLWKGKQVHVHLVSNRSELDLVVGNALINMYGKCGDLKEAWKVFRNLPECNVVSWNALIRAHGQHGEHGIGVKLFGEMQVEGIVPDRVTYISILSMCACHEALEEGRYVHNLMLCSQSFPDVVVQTALVNMYGKCGSLEDARIVFSKMMENNVVSWTAIITAHARHGHGKEALDFFQEMHLDGVISNKVTFATVLDVCANEEALDKARQLHDYIIYIGFELDVIVWNALVNMYGKCDCLEDAQILFDNMYVRDLFSWTALMGAYVQGGCGIEVFQIFQQMLLEGMIPDKLIFMNMLLACSNQGVQGEGMRMHVCMHGNMSEIDGVMLNALVSMYGSCGNIDNAQVIFNGMTERNVDSWNNLIVMYVQHGLGRLAFQYFQQMQMEGVLANRFTFPLAFSACANRAMLTQGSHLHACISGSGFEFDTFVQNSLVSMYGKCGAFNAAHKTFLKISERDAVSWNAMIGLYAEYGHFEDVIYSFQQMQLESVLPDDATFISILSVFATEAALCNGKWMHSQIAPCKYVIIGNALVNMYGKCGSLDDAQSIFENMSKWDAVSWTTIISAYACHGCAQQVFLLFQKMQVQGMTPDKFTFSSVLSACSHSGLGDDGHAFFLSMQRDYDISPTVVHYNCMIDLLGRLGRLDEVEGLIKAMPSEPTIASWLTVLGACKVHMDVERGKWAAEQISSLDTENVTPYVLLWNIYTLADSWIDAENHRKG